MNRAEALALLRLQVDWGADDALGDEPVDRMARPAAVLHRLADPAPAPAAPPPRDSVQALELAAAAADLASLDAAMAGFEGCGLRATATMIVAPSGNASARLMLIGEAPGTEDDRSGAAFSGPTGALLDRMLASIGLDRSGVLLTTLVPWRPPGNRAPTEAELRSCLPFLHRRMQLMQPRHLVLFGGLAVRLLAGPTDGIRRLRGRWLTVAVPGLDAPIPALPMLPVDQAVSAPGLKQATWTDLLSLRDALSRC